MNSATGLNGIYLPLQFTEALFVEVVLLLIGLPKISLTKSVFNHPSVYIIASWAVYWPRQLMSMASM
jgi:hypothetical protein